MIASLRLHALSAATLLALTLTAPAAQAFSDDEARRAILELRTQIKQLNDQNQQARLQLADQMDRVLELKNGKILPY